MPRRIRHQRSDNEVLRERADRCRRLADGVGDLNFAIKLYALSWEYDNKANGLIVAYPDGFDTTYRCAAVRADIVGDS
jgi:hypothetical protein